MAPPRMATHSERLRMLCERCDQHRALILPADPLLGFIAVSATIGSCADSDGRGLSCSVGWTCCLGSRLACLLLRAELNAPSLTMTCWGMAARSALYTCVPRRVNATEQNTA